LYSPSALALKYLRYYVNAANGKGHGVHSPFVFTFIKEVLNDRTNYPEYAKVEKLRQKLRNDHRDIQVLDLGAGSVHGDGSLRKISTIARNAAKPAKFGQLLFRIMRHYKPEQVLELGTSLGITTAYLAMGNRATTVSSIEGSPAVADIAGQNLQELSLQNVQVQTGGFDELLPAVAKSLTGSALVFIDGNHSKQPTLNYFHTLLPRLGHGSILIFDDIHWSKGMEEAWEEISAHPSVMLTIDLFFIGIVFFRNEFQIKQQFTIRF
jgi:predicted O-methyltransferase YrrM